MEVLSKEEFSRRLLRDQRKRKVKVRQEKEREIIAYLASQKGK